jgi:hypothetical protein
MRRRRAGAATLAAMIACLAAAPASASSRDREHDVSRETVRFTVAATGDVITHAGVLKAARAPGSAGGYDFVPLLRGLGPRIAAADLALCHQELVLGPGPPQGYPRFLAPPALARGMAGLGWDACSVASNHSVDHGAEGVATTIAALDAAGLRHTGTYRSAAARRRTLIMRVSGIGVALLSYTETTNGLSLPFPFSVGLIDEARILDDARRARRRGADAVIVNLHDVGDLELPIPDYLRRLADRLTESPAITAVISQGPHVARPIRFLNGKPVVFSEGELLASRQYGIRNGLIAELRFVASSAGVRVAAVRYLPLHLRARNFAVVTVARALRHRNANRRALRLAYRRVIELAGRSHRVRPVPRRFPYP